MEAIMESWLEVKTNAMEIVFAQRSCFQQYVSLLTVRGCNVSADKNDSNWNIHIDRGSFKDKNVLKIQTSRKILTRENKENRKMSFAKEEVAVINKKWS